jgi:hypothetical protein
VPSWLALLANTAHRCPQQPGKRAVPPVKCVLVVAELFIDAFAAHQRGYFICRAQPILDVDLPRRG